MRSGVWFLLSGAWLLYAGISLPTPARQGAPQPKVEFNRDIRPIISKCFTCHGPSTGDGYAGLRLDAFDTATKTLKSGRRAIVPGHPEQSELIERVNATDPNVLMPPPDSHKILKDEEKQLLRDWIQEGAIYKQHWAFVKPIRPAFPSVKDAKWPKTGIDRFVLAKLEEHELKPEPEADKATLIRRVTLDITGLPPTPEEVDAFVADKSKDAYEKLVDRLLASPRYGERMAMDWMDYARYADSNGYQADYERYQSRWRDWVIDAFNANMPYDEFTIEQIAGDLLPNATTDQKLATAFNRNHRINTEGGVIAEEWRVENVVDRVETTTAVWLGLTAGCARCHDHKYDPLTQKDFYRLFAYFNNVPESGSGEERPINHPPTLRVPTREQTAKLAELTKALANFDTGMANRLTANARKAEGWKLSEPIPEVKDGLVQRFKLVPGTGKAEGKVGYETGRATGAVKTNNDAYLDLGGVGDFEKDQAFSFGAWIKPDRTEGSPFSRMDANNGFRGWEFSFYQGRPQTHLINKWPENAVKVAGKDMLPVNRWTHVFVTYDGKLKSLGLKIYINGKPIETVVERDALTETIRTEVTTKIGRRTNSEQFTGAVDDFAIFNRELKADEVAKLASTHPGAALLTVPEANRTKEQKAELVRLWSLDNDKAYRDMDDARNQTGRDREQLDASIPTVMVMEEMPKPRDCFILNRGQYDKHGEKVDAGLPAFLPAGKDLPNNRLGLAKWIVSPDNPLTARVTVNRLWERFFGNGIVSTVEDFGTRAEFPTNPELLDYLAVDFQKKWDLKGIIREIVMSAAYRQSSNLTAEKIEKDPQNRFVSRGPRYRLPGEVIRDQALYAAGLLTEKIGGPSVRPYMPDGVWDETNFYGNLRNYQHDKGPNLHRRSLYTIWKRTAAPPNMLMFDVPSREACRVRRARTDTPLQALTLLNDVTYLEASRALAQKMIREGGSSIAERVTYGFRRVLSRAPSADELKLLVTGVEKRLATYRKDPQAAEDVALIGDAKLDLGLDRAEIAAYTITASTLLNLDEAVTKE